MKRAREEEDGKKDEKQQGKSQQTRSAEAGLSHLVDSTLNRGLYVVVVVVVLLLYLLLFGRTCTFVVESHRVISNSKPIP